MANSGINAVRFCLYNYVLSEMETDRQGHDLASSIASPTNLKSLSVSERSVTPVQSMQS